MAATLTRPNRTSVDAGTDSCTYNRPAATWTNGNVAAAQTGHPLDERYEAAESPAQRLGQPSGDHGMSHDRVNERVYQRGTLG